jgi:glycerol-3-phosphate cytidylyltransferase-like family protein
VPYQIEYKAYGLSGCNVEVEREALKEAKKLADKLCGYLCHEAKVRDMVTGKIVYDTEDREGSG